METGRLVLRAAVLDDFPAHAAMWADSRTRTHFQHTPFSEEECWVRFLRSAGQWVMLGYGSWAVQHKESKKYIGSVGLINVRRTMNLAMKDSPEAGWVIAPDFHRQGFGREALSAALAWADRTLHCDTWCMIDPPNVPSKMLADSVGYRSHSTVEYKDHPMEVFFRECPTE